MEWVEAARPGPVRVPEEERRGEERRGEARREKEGSNNKEEKKKKKKKKKKGLETETGGDRQRRRKESKMWKTHPARSFSGSLGFRTSQILTLPSSPVVARTYLPFVIDCRHPSIHSFIDSFIFIRRVVVWTKKGFVEFLAHQLDRSSPPPTLARNESQIESVQ